MTWRYYATQIGGGLDGWRMIKCRRGVNGQATLSLLPMRHLMISGGRFEST